jgi:DNA-binding beta-propeller fold protein YncE
VVAVLVFSIGNWLFNRQLEEGDAASSAPGLLMGASVLLLGGLYWALVHTRTIRATYDLDRGGRGWRDLLSTETLVGFIPYLIFWFLATWVIYTYAGEKMAWLSSHFIFPMVLLAGWYVNDRLELVDVGQLLSRRFALVALLFFLVIVAFSLALLPLLLGTAAIGSQRAGDLRAAGSVLGWLLLGGLTFYFLRKAAEPMEKRARRVARLVAVIGLLGLLTIRFSYMAAFPNADYVTEFMVYAHGAPATKSQVLSQLESLSLRLYGDKSIQVAYDNDSSWPYTWYLRDYPNRLYFGENPGRNVADAPVLIVGARNWNRVEPLLADNYEVRTYTFLWWPMEEYRKISWNAIFGDPNVEPELRRGLADPLVRQGLWDIFIYRDYRKYGQAFENDYSIGRWPVRHELRMYIRKDVLATIWDHGVDAVATEPPVDPYAENQLELLPDLVIGSLLEPPGRLSQPRNLAVAPDGTVFIADSGQHRIAVFDQNGNFLRSWGSFGEGAGQLNEPWGLAVDDEHVYVADTWNHRIQKFTHDGELVDAFGANGGPTAEDPGNGLFYGPRDVAILPDGHLLITDTGNHRLQVLDNEGNFVRAVGSRGAFLGQFQEPVGLGVGPDGYIYVADTWNGRVQRLAPDLNPDGEWEVDAWFGDSINNKPYVAVGPDNLVYISDPEAYRVIIFDPAGNYVGRFGQYSTGADGFGLPNGIKVDGLGTVYVADAGNNQILRFSRLP